MLRKPVALLFAALCFGQVLTPGPQVTTFLSDIDDSDQPYGLYLPRDFDAKKKYPLVISLHGADSNHRINLRRVFGLSNRIGESDAQATHFFPKFKDVEFIVASPLARGTMGYQGIAEKDVYDVLADVKRRFPIDEDRIYLTGLSMGGGGTLWLGLSRPDVWAAMAPVCPAPPPGADLLAGNALNVPVKIFQGEMDPTVKAADTRAWYKRLLDAGVQAEYVEYPGVRHNSWDNAYKNGAIFDWFAKFKRNRFPDRVQFASADYAHGKAYWLQFDHLSPGTIASIDASFGSPNSLTVKTSELGAFSLHLKGHPKLNMGLPLTLNIDGKAMRVRAAPLVSFTKTPSGWVNRKSVPANDEKRLGSEGPIREAISERHIYVYGTADAPSPSEVARRRSEASYAAMWSSPRHPLLLQFRVAADDSVTEADSKNASLVLFGNKNTNRWIARFAANLPIRLNPDAADYGLVLLTPTQNGHYAVISSGLPWWTRSDQAKRPGLSFISQAHNILLSFGDYVLFKGGLDGVVAEGMFDEHWQLSPEARQALEATHAVALASRPENRRTH